jgi:hypothetical protein
MHIIIVVLDTWEINISCEKDNLVVASSFFQDCCEKDDLAVAMLFFKINVTRIT